MVNDEGSNEDAEQNSVILGVALISVIVSIKNVIFRQSCSHGRLKIGGL